MAYLYPDQLIQGIASPDVTKPCITSTMVGVFNQDEGDYLFPLVSDINLTCTLSLQLVDIDNNSILVSVEFEANTGAHILAKLHEVPGISADIVQGHLSICYAGKAIIIQHQNIQNPATRVVNPLFAYYYPDSRSISMLGRLASTPARTDSSPHSVTSILAHAEGRESENLNRAPISIVRALSAVVDIADTPVREADSVEVQNTLNAVQGAYLWQAAPGATNPVDGIALQSTSRFWLTDGSASGPVNSSGAHILRTQDTAEYTSLLGTGHNQEHILAPDGLSLVLAEIPANLQENYTGLSTEKRELGAQISLDSTHIINDVLGLNANAAFDPEFVLPAERQPVRFIDNTTIYFYNPYVGINLEYVVFTVSVNGDLVEVQLREKLDEHRYLISPIQGVGLDGEHQATKFTRHFSLPEETIVYRLTSPILRLHWPSEAQYIRVELHRYAGEPTQKLSPISAQESIVDIYNKLDEMSGFSAPELSDVSLASLHAKGVLTNDAYARLGNTFIPLPANVKNIGTQTTSVSSPGELGLTLQGEQALVNAPLYTEADNNLQVLIDTVRNTDIQFVDTEANLSDSDILSALRPYWRSKGSIGPSFPQSRQNSPLFNMRRMAITVSPTAESKFEAHDLGRVVFLSAIEADVNLGTPVDEIHSEEVTGHYIITRVASSEQVFVEPANRARGTFSSFTTGSKPIAFVKLFFLSRGEALSRLETSIDIEQRDNRVSLLATEVRATTFIRDFFGNYQVPVGNRPNNSNGLGMLHEVGGTRAFIHMGSVSATITLEDLLSSGIVIKPVTIAKALENVVNPDLQREYKPVYNTTREYEIIVETTAGVARYRVTAIVAAQRNNTNDFYYQCEYLSGQQEALQQPAVPLTLSVFDNDGVDTQPNNNLTTNYNVAQIDVSARFGIRFERIELHAVNLSANETKTSVRENIVAPNINTGNLNSKSISAGSGTSSTDSRALINAKITSTEDYFNPIPDVVQATEEELSAEFSLSVSHSGAEADRAPTAELAVHGYRKQFIETVIDANDMLISKRYTNSPFTVFAPNWADQQDNDVLDNQHGIIHNNRITQRATRLTSAGIALLSADDTNESIIPDSRKTDEDSRITAELSFRKLANSTERSELHIQNTFGQNGSNELFASSGMLNCKDGAFLLQTEKANYEENLRTDDNDGYGAGNELSEIVNNGPTNGLGDQARFRLESHFRDNQETYYSTAMHALRAQVVGSRHYEQLDPNDPAYAKTQLSQNDLGSRQNLQGELRAHQTELRVGKFQSPLAIEFTKDGVEQSTLAQYDYYPTEIGIKDSNTDPDKYEVEPTTLFKEGEQYISWEHLRALTRQLESLHSWANSATNRFQHLGLAVQYMSSFLVDIQADLTNLENAFAGNQAAQTAFANIRAKIIAYQFRKRADAPPSDGNDNWPLSNVEESFIAALNLNLTRTEALPFPDGHTKVPYLGNMDNGFERVDHNNVRKYVSTDFSKNPRDLPEVSFSRKDGEKAFLNE